MPTEKLKFIFICPTQNRMFESADFSVLENRGVIVSDNGNGIPDKIADKLFTPFATHGKTGGTGLGLAITKQIIDAHGGTITVGSSAEGGAEFTITLPVA